MRETPMRSQRIGSVALVALSYTLALLSDNVLASSYSYTAPSDCVASYIGDGNCDLVNDNEDCDYGGGDCCECTCVSTEEYEYGYDGGDCCECTCVSTDRYECGAYGGYACLDPSAPCADDDDWTTVPTFGSSCLDHFIRDSHCDPSNNNEECGYDGGDCCVCTCAGTGDSSCGGGGPGTFECLDPSAPCFGDEDDDDYIMYDDDEDMSASYSYELSLELPLSVCNEGRIGDGDCQPANNVEKCDYDGGDCCECTCDYTIPFSCDLFFDPIDCIDPSAPCVNDYVEAGTKTTVGVSANGYDTRPGQASNNGGCQEDGCAPALTRDGVSDDIESRWSCSHNIVPDGSFCELEFTFESPQNVVDVQVAFPYRVNNSYRLEVAINGEVIGDVGWYQQLGVTFIGLGLKANDVSTLTLRHTEIEERDSRDWISIFEVRFLVEP